MSARGGNIWWTIALAASVLWPSRVLSPLDGVPLNGRAEAVLLGLALPALRWMDGDFLKRPLVGLRSWRCWH